MRVSGKEGRVGYKGKDEKLKMKICPVFEAIRGTGYSREGLIVGPVLPNHSLMSLQGGR